MITMEKRKCAIIGMGLLGTQHAQRLFSHNTTELTAVCDIKPEKARAWAEPNKIPWYDNLEELLKIHKPEILVVATQDPYHKDPIIVACKHHVPYIISEKPLATSLKDALEIREAAKTSNTKIKVLFPNRFYPLDQAIRLLLKEGLIGKPEYGEMRMDDSITVPRRLWGKDSYQYASISSPVHFLLSHAVDLLLFYFSPHHIKKVYAVGRKSVIGSQVDYLDSFLTFDDNLLFRLKTEWTKRMETLVENYVQLTAQKGGVVFNKTPGFQCTQGLRISFDEGKKTAELALELLENNGIRGKIVSYNEPTEYSLDLRAVDGNDFDWNHGVCIYADSFDVPEPALSPLTDLNGGIEQVEVVDALLRSAEEGREISL
jgi:predicted dehydrogenase